MTQPSATLPVTAQNLRSLTGDLLNLPGGLIPILQRIQTHFGYIPKPAVSFLAKELNLSRAEVHGVVTFYHDFRTEKPGKHIIKICQAEACQALGSERLTRHAAAQLHAQLHETSRDGAVTLEPVYCLGNCALSPAIMIDNILYGRVSPERFDQLTRSLSDLP